MSGDVSAARQTLEEVLPILREVDDQAGLCRSLQFLGLVLASEGQYDLADRAMQDAVDIARALGDLNKGSFSLTFIGDIALQQGDRVRAKRVYEECANLLRRLGNEIFEAYPLRRLGYLALEEDDAGRAWRYFRESLRLNRKVRDQRGVAACLTAMAALAVHVHKPLVAARLLGVVESQLESLNTPLFYLDAVELERVRGKAHRVTDEANFAAARSQGWELSEDEAINLLDEVVGELAPR